MVLNALEGVSRFFQWLYVGVTSVWQSFSLIVIFLAFIVVQIGFIWLYYKMIKFTFNLYPRLQEIFRRIDRFFT